MSWGGSPVTSADGGSENLSLSQGGKEHREAQKSRLFWGFFHIVTYRNSVETEHTAFAICLVKVSPFLGLKVIVNIIPQLFLVVLYHSDPKVGALQRWGKKIHATI